MRGQFRHDFRQLIHAQINRHRRLMLCQFRQTLPGGHRGFAGMAGQNQRLADPRQGQFPAQHRRPGKGSSHPRHHLIRNPQPVQFADLLADGTIQGRIAGMHPRHIQPLFMGGVQAGDDLFQTQIRGIDDLCCRVGRQHDFFRHQRTGVQHQRAFADQPPTLDGNQFGIAGTGPDKVDGHRNFP